MTEPWSIVHVERTPVPDVLRWVCHRADLEATPLPPAGSSLAALLREGAVTSITARAGDLLVRFPTGGDADEPTLVAAVHRAVVEALGADGWTAPTGISDVTIRSRGPSRASVSGSGDGSAPRDT